MNLATTSGRRAPGPEALETVLEPIRLKHSLPALGGAVVSSEGLQAVGAVGVRRSGTDVAVTRNDLWHLGSDTKAMTAAMIGRLVEQGRLTWETTIGETFPELDGKLPPGIGKITLLELLSHRSGLPANTLWGVAPREGTTREQRLFVVGTLARVRPVAAPGTAYLYSNLGYVVAGATAEKAADASWEDLMRRLVFGPLSMTSAGFGGTGTPGRVDQSWPHVADGKPVPKNGPDADNPPVMGPAGTVHCSLSDWGKFISDQLRSARGGAGRGL